MAFGLGKWDATVDVVVVGSGLGGLSAAIVAHDAGSRSLVLEKAPKLGGVSAYSGGEVFVPDNHLQDAAAIGDSREEGLKYLEFLAGGYADPELQRVLLDTGRQAARYFQEKAGVRWKIVKGFPDYHYPHAPGHRGRGPLPRGRSSSRARRSATGRRRRTSRRTCPTASRTTSSSPGAASST